MKRGFYRKIAWNGIRKNRRLYVPYLLTCIGMVGMFYIISFLSSNELLLHLRGGDVLQVILGLGRGVVGVFALIFLFYTNSFLVRRRKKEFGLYNILGMSKRNLALVLLWEGVAVAFFSLVGGLTAGIALSKFAELGMVNLVLGEVEYSLSVSWEAVQSTVLLFLCIFCLILLYTLGQIRLTNPIELLRSENAGEKPPKANWLFALLGAVLLGGAYWLAVSLKEPIEAIVWFFIAVIMVILATYLLFIAGSVVLCRLLQKKKSYYYQTKHFVSVSSMIYRMKRNGAGLASICILCTMVLVMLSSTVCLYFGSEDSIQARYPRNVNLCVRADSMEQMESGQREAIRREALEMTEKSGMHVEQVMDYLSACFTAYIRDGKIETGGSSGYVYQTDNFAGLWEIYLIPLEDYNRMTGREETLAPGEVLLSTNRSVYENATLTFPDGEVWQIKKQAEDFEPAGNGVAHIISSMYLFLPDYSESVKPFLELTGEDGAPVVGLEWNYGFDTDGTQEEQSALTIALRQKLREQEQDSPDNALHIFRCEGDAEERVSFYSLNGGLFFLGILLGTVFLFAAVLIMYYKQISEGYEDQSRFAIMQKVGMKKKDIRDSVNSQILTVFFLPLLTAGLHLLFAYPMIQKMLVLFGLVNTRLMTQVTAGCYLGFVVFYILVYRITSRAYYGIVSGGKEER